MLSCDTYTGNIKQSSARAPRAHFDCLFSPLSEELLLREILPNLGGGAVVRSVDDAWRDSVTRPRWTPDGCWGAASSFDCGNSWGIKGKHLKETTWHRHWREKESESGCLRHETCSRACVGGLGGRSLNQKSTRGKRDWGRQIRLIGYPWKIALLGTKLGINGAVGHLWWWFDVVSPDRAFM